VAFKCFCYPWKCPPLAKQDPSRFNFLDEKTKMNK